MDNNKDLQELRTQTKEILFNLVQKSGDKYCNGCLWFRYKTPKIGAPENQPVMYCEILEYSSKTGKRETTMRFTDCFIANFKETK